MHYSVDLRTRVVDAVRSGISKTKASKVYKVCLRTIYNWLELIEKTGSLDPCTGYQKGHSHGITDYAAFRNFVDEHSDYTQEEIAQHFSVGSSTVGRTLKKLNYSRKKRVKLIQKEVKRNVKNTRKQYKKLPQKK